MHNLASSIAHLLTSIFNFYRGIRGNTLCHLYFHHFLRLKNGTFLPIFKPKNRSKTTTSCGLDLIFSLVTTIRHHYYRLYVARDERMNVKPTFSTPLVRGNISTVFYRFVGICPLITLKWLHLYTPLIITDKSKYNFNTL